mgnify:CR=1 FL=1
MNKRAVNTQYIFILYFLILFISTEAVAWGVPDIVKKAQETLNGTQNKSDDNSTEKKKEFSVAKDATIGAAFCGGLFKILGKADDDVVKAALACGAANAAVTVLAKQGKDKYAKQYSQITSDMASSEKEINLLEGETRSNNQKVNTYQSQVNNLILKEKDDERFIHESAGLREKLDKQLLTNKSARSKAAAKLEILDKQIAELDVIINDSPDIDSLQATKITLVQQKGRLTTSVKQANGMNDELLAQKSKLDNEVIKRS